jgi:tetratricopeptide (TPR) repeat protein
LDRTAQLRANAAVAALTAIAGLAAIAALAACGEREETDPTVAEPPDAPLTFVGREVCEPCHVAETDLWKGSHHDLAMQIADETSVLGDFDDAQFTHFGVTSSFFRRDGKFFARTDGPDGELHDYEIPYVFGFDPLQQYLIELPGGRFQALSVSWDSRPEREGGQRWFHLYPEEPIPHGDVLHWTGPNQNWNFMCADCHSTRLEKNYLADEERYETRWEEIDVSCEACHGPGSAHVAWANERAESGADKDPSGDLSDADDGSTDDLSDADDSSTGDLSDADDGSTDDLRDADDGLTVDLRNDGVWRFNIDEKVARRTPEKGADAQIDTCGRCHARRSVLHPEPVRGQPLADTHRTAFLDESLYHADGQILEEVYVWGSFVQSRMYAAGVVCTDCHEGHALQLPENPDLICLGCHRADLYAVPDHHHHKWKSTGASCVACHMLARTYMGVDLRHDHSFRVPRPDLTVAIGTPDTCTDCHADQSADWSAEAAERWYGTERSEKPHYGQILQAGREGAPGASRALAELAAEPSAPAIVRGTALRLLPPEPQTADAVRRGLGDEDPLVRVAALESADNVEPRLRLKLARQLLNDPVLGVRIQAARAMISTPEQLWDPGDRARLERPLAQYRAAQMENADRPEARLNLAVLAIALGDLESARAEYETALRLGPWFVPTYVNLADLHRQTQRDDEAERVLRTGLARVGDNAELSYALGLTLVRRGRSSEAIAEFARAAELAPESPRYAYVYGIALNSAGEVERARRVLDDAYRRHPGDRSLLTGLVTLSRDAGELEVALRYAVALVELIPQDPGARQLLADIQSRLDGGQ